MSAPTWNKDFELPDGSCFVQDIQEFCEYSIKTQEAVTNNPIIKI